MQYIVTSHTNSYLSGVAKFNKILADKLNIRCLGVKDAFLINEGPVLLSIKLRDHNDGDLSELQKLIQHFDENNIVYDLFLHTFDELDMEYYLTEHCRTIYCGNTEISHSLEGQNKEVKSLFCPPLVNQENVVQENKINIFSFGMAHKIQIRHYERLCEILSAFKIPYSLWISTAFHEKANFGDFMSISEDMSQLFDTNIQFLGFLSDDAVNYFIDKSHLFVAFFSKGVRANNTSVFVAMQRGCCVLTNCDEHSPDWFVHGENILDISKISVSDVSIDKLEYVSRNAKDDVKKHVTWDSLKKQFI